MFDCSRHKLESLGEVRKFKLLKGNDGEFVEIEKSHSFIKYCVVSLDFIIFSDQLSKKMEFYYGFSNLMSILSTHT